jgi:hypothetical protein
MGIRYENLDEKTRECMFNELQLDISKNAVYYSKRLNQTGLSNWLQLLSEAIKNFDDIWLQGQIQNLRYLNTHEQRTRKGVPYSVQVPYTAAETLAEGEFNRFYARGVCVRSINENLHDVEVYRGKPVQNPRFESESKLGQIIPATALLNDLRTSQGIEPALGIPPGPNSGLTIRLPRKSKTEKF